MRAIRVHHFGDPSVMSLEALPDPVPADGQLLVQLHAVGVNPVDTYIRAGAYGARPFPYTPGSDAAGVVRATGPGVSRFSPGQRVYVAGSLTGTYADLALCTESQVHPLPDRLSFAQGAAIGVPYATAHRALFHRGGARPGESVLIHGATGGVGIAAVQLARSAGLRIFATGGSPQGRSMLQDLKADHVLDHHAPDYLQHLMALTQDRGVDLILEMLANVNLGKDLTVLAPSGRVIVIGSRGRVEIDPRDTMKREADIRGLILMAATKTQLAETHAALAKGLEDGTLTPIVGQQFPLADAPRAHEAIMAAAAYGKVVLLP